MGSQAWRALSECCLQFDCIDGKTTEVKVRSIKSKDIENPIPPIRVTLERETARFRMMLEDEEAPIPPPLRATTPSEVRVDRILGLRASHPGGVAWLEVPSLLEIPPLLWKDYRTRLQDELLRLEHVVIGGVLKWAAEVDESPL
jgi:hypothetical protein